MLHLRGEAGSTLASAPSKSGKGTYEMTVPTNVHLAPALRLTLPSATESCLFFILIPTFFHPKSYVRPYAER